VLALPGAIAGATAGLADLLLLGVVSASLGLAAVMGVIMLRELHHVCLLCLSMDAVVLAWFITVVPLAARFEPTGASWRGRKAARAIVLAGAVVAVAGGTLAAVRTPGGVTTVQEIQTRDPKFYAWYTSLPVRSMDDLITPGCHVKGPPGATVAIVEFSDFQCPFCAEAYRDLRDLLRARSDVSLVFRNYPLDTSCNTKVSHSLHPDACLAACAAECAAQQGHFWEYHDTLFENHDHLARDDLFRYAREMRLEISAFRTCLDDPATRARIDEDVQAAAKAGVGSTPTIFINGRTVEGALERAYYEYAVVIEQHARHDHPAQGAS
jgi:protein-disulfide isomerase